jgi:hypothetical protein
MSTERDRDLEKIFTYHPPKDNQAVRYEEIRKAAKGLAVLIEDLCPESRERTNAFTHIECVVFWANASIARNE